MPTSKVKLLKGKFLVLTVTSLVRSPHHYTVLQITVTLARAQIVFHSAKNRKLAPSDMVTSSLRSLLLSPMGDRISEVPLFLLLDNKPSLYLIQRLIELNRQTTTATTTCPQSAVEDEEKYIPAIESSAGPATSLCTYSGSSIYDQVTSKVTLPLLAPWLSPHTFAMVKIENDASPGNTVAPVLMPLLPRPVTVSPRKNEVPQYSCRGDHQYPQKRFIQRGVPFTRNKGDYESF